MSFIVIMMKNISKEEELLKEIENLKKDSVEFKNKYLRALADYQNLEKRIALQREESAKYASTGVIMKLLSVFDTLEKAEKHLKDQGLSLGVKSFWDALKSENVTRIDTVRKKFDPVEMECVEVFEGEDDDMIAEEVRPGYKLNGKVIRVAQVKVSKKTKGKTEEKIK